MLLRGSCQCGKVGFRVESDTPYPFMFCYCSICRKTTGALACNVMGSRATLVVTGKRHLRLHRAVVRQPGKRAVRSKGERWFCGACGTHLYALHDDWPDGVWPNAAALDTPLPPAPSNVHLMLRYKPAWVPTPGRGPRFEEFPELSIADWHAGHHRSAATARRDLAAAKRRRAPKGKGQ